MSGRKKSGAIASGAGKAGDGGKIEIIAGAFAFVEGSTPDKFRITRPSFATVDGKEYRNEELTVGKWYVLGKNVSPGADFLTFGAAANGNGMVSADIGKDLMFFDRSLSPDELQSASLEVVKKVKPEVLR